MGTIYNFSGTTTSGAVIPTSTWTTTPNKVAKVYINSIFAVLPTKPVGGGLIPWTRVRMSVTNSLRGTGEHNVLEVGYRAFKTSTSVFGVLPSLGFAKGVHVDGTTTLTDGQLALEMAGGCGSQIFDYQVGAVIISNDNDMANVFQRVLDNTLNNNTLTGTAKIYCTVDAVIGSAYVRTGVMAVSYCVPEYFYLNQGDVLKLHDHTGSASLSFTVVSET